MVSDRELVGGWGRVTVSGRAASEKVAREGVPSCALCPAWQVWSHWAEPAGSLACEQEEGQVCLRQTGRPGHLQGDCGPYSISAWGTQVRGLWAPHMDRRLATAPATAEASGPQEFRAKENSEVMCFSPSSGLRLHQALPPGY